MDTHKNGQTESVVDAQKKAGRRLNDRLRSQITFEKTWTDTIADFCTSMFGSVWFLILNAGFFAVWIIANTPQLGFTPFDPFPFGLLTMVVSLEAIFLSIIVLISQNRQGKIADIRQRVNFEVDVRAEDEITKILRMLEGIEAHLGMSMSKDAELARMEKKTDLNKIQREVENAN